VLAAGGLLLVGIGLFLTFGHMHMGFNAIDIPARLGVNITQQANHVIYTQSRAGHTLFKIDAAKVVQVKAGSALLSDATIDLYSADGSRVDQIVGHQFEYDPKAGIAKAMGPVEIVLMKPGVAPAIAPNATPGHVFGAKVKGRLAAAAATAESDNIHVKTSGLIFDQKTGVASTRERVEFSMAQGAGSATGASFDSQLGQMVLSSAVQLRLHRGTGDMELRANHAEFERGNRECKLLGARADMNQSQATANEATILFRPDGAAERLDVNRGFALTTAAGNHLSAPRGRLEFDEKNHPRMGHLEGGVEMNSTASGRSLQGTAPSAELSFSAEGELQHAHLERGVDFTSHEEREQSGGLMRLNRRWQSPVADLEFHSIANEHGTHDSQGTARTGKRLELTSIHGTGGVAISSESQLRGQAHTQSSRLAAADMVASFGGGGSLRSVIGKDNATIEETTETGAHQVATGDRLEATFSSPTGRAKRVLSTGSGSTNSVPENIERATLFGRVVLTQTPEAARPTQPGAQTNRAMNATVPEPLRATAGRADYEGAGEWLHLSLSPRAENGALQISAEKIDLSRASGLGFAHGNVKTTWQEVHSSNADPARNGGRNTGVDSGMNASPRAGAARASAGLTTGLGAQGPTHIVSAEAEMRQADEEVIFRGQVRMWQGTNSITAPVITLNRKKQMLTASLPSTPNKGDKGQRVQAVFLSASEQKTDRNRDHRNADQKSALQTAPQPDAAHLIRLRGERLEYWADKRTARMQGGSGVVTTETGNGTVTSDDVEMVLVQDRAVHSASAKSTGGDGAEEKIHAAVSASESNSKIDHLIAHGHVVLSSGGRRGIGEQLTYTSATGQYVLTGTDKAPPKLTDSERGTMTGEALIFNSRDDSVSVEGGSRKTLTETHISR